MRSWLQNNLQRMRFCTAGMHTSPSWGTSSSLDLSGVTMLLCINSINPDVSLSSSQVLRAGCVLHEVIWPNTSMQFHDGCT